MKTNKTKFGLSSALFAFFASTITLVADSTKYFTWETDAYANQILTDTTSTGTGDISVENPETTRVLGISNDTEGNWAGFNPSDTEANYQFGGAVFLYDSTLRSEVGTVLEVSGTFVGNYAYSGGAVYLLESDTILNGVDITTTFDIDANFIGNSAAYGGAIYVAQGTINNLSGDFTGNYAYGDYSKGGAIFNKGTISNIKSNFLNNYVYSENDYVSALGGAIYNEVTISSIAGYFTGNSVTSTAYWAGGGAIYNDGTITSVSGDFSANYANGVYSEGGAIYNDYYGAMSVEGTFSNNYAIGDSALGGAVYVYASTMTFSANTKDITNIGNWAGTSKAEASDANGGFLYSYYGTIIFDIGDSYTMTIGDGTVDCDSIAGSGTIEKTGIGTLTINSSMKYFTGTLSVSAGTFNLNNDFGGRINISSNTKTTTTITNSSFTDNDYSSMGGAIYNYYYSTLSVNDTCFSNNKAGSSGGAIWNYGTMSLLNVVFSDNYTSSTGGAIYNYSGASISSIIGTFTSNESSMQGGAIYNNGTILSIKSAFSGNSATLGGAIYNANSIKYIEGEFTDNSAITKSAYGGAIYNATTIDSIVGEFIANYVSSEYSMASGGGAIANSSGDTISNITASFVGNYVETVSTSYIYALGGAVYNAGEIIFSSLEGTSIYNYGNYVINANDEKYDQGGGFLYSKAGTTTFNTAAKSSIIIGDGTIGYDSIASSNSSSIIYKTGEGELLVNSSMEFFSGTMYLQGGTFTLSNSFGGSLDISAASLNVVISSNNASDSAIINALIISDTSVDSENPYTIKVSYADDLTLNQYQDTVTIFTADSSLESLVKLSVELPTGYSSYEWTASTTYNTVILTAQTEGGESLGFDTETDGSTTANVSGGDFYLGDNDSVDVDNIESTDGSSLVLNGGTATTATDNLVIGNDDSTNASELQVASGTIDASAAGASVALSEGTTSVGDFTVIGTLTVGSNSTLDSGDDALTLDEVELAEDATLSLGGNIYAYDGETIRAEGTSTSSLSVDAESLNNTIEAGDTGSVSISSDTTVSAATALSFTSTTADVEGNSTTTSATNLDLDINFDNSVEGDKTAVSTNVDTVYGASANISNGEISSDKVFSGTVSASLTSDDVDANSVAAITTTGGVINLADGSDVSATITDSEGNITYGNALTNYHEDGATDVGLTVAIELGGSAYILGNITANSDLTLTSTTTSINSLTVVNTGTTLTVAGGYITTNYTEDYKLYGDDSTLTVDGINLVLTTDGNGTLASFSDVGVISTTNSGTITVEASADLLVGASYEIADSDTFARNSTTFYSLIDYDRDSFSLLEGVLTVVSLDTFQVQATSQNEMNLAVAVDAISGLTSDNDYQDKIDFKSEVEANGLGSYVIGSNSYIAEVNTMLLSNMNFANVNRARSILEKSAGIQLEDEDGSISFENEDGTISVVDASEVSLIKYSNVAQLQSINLLGSKSASNGVAGYDYWSVGSTANFDEILSEKALVGVSIGGTYNKVEGDAGDNANSTTFLLNAYAVYAYEGLEVFGNIGYAHFWNEGSKASAKADWDSDAFNALIGVSYDIETTLEGLTFTPLAMFNLVCLDADSASYSNGVNVDSESYFSAKLILGFEVEYAITEQFNVLARAMYSHEMGDTSYDNRYSLGFVNGVNYIGSEAGADSAVMGLGLSYDFSETCTAYFDYNAYAYSNLITHSLNLSVGIKF